MLLSSVAGTPFDPTRLNGYRLPVDVQIKVEKSDCGEYRIVVYFLLSTALTTLLDLPAYLSSFVPPLAPSSPLSPYSSFELIAADVALRPAEHLRLSSSACRYDSMATLSKFGRST